MASRKRPAAAGASTPPEINFRRNADFGSTPVKLQRTLVDARIIACKFQGGDRKDQDTGAFVLAYKAGNKQIAEKLAEALGSARLCESIE